MSSLSDWLLLGLAAAGAFLQVASGHYGSAIGLVLFAAFAWTVTSLLERMPVSVPDWVCAAIPGAVIAAVILLLRA